MNQSKDGGDVLFSLLLLNAISTCTIGYLPHGDKAYFGEADYVREAPTYFWRSPHETSPKNKLIIEKT